jgi:hypothetical protein
MLATASGSLTTGLDAKEGQSLLIRGGTSSVIEAAHLIRKLYEVPLPGCPCPPGPEFPLPAKLTVTAISGGQGYSMAPDLYTVKVDIRLTPELDDPAAVTLLHEAVAGADAAWPGTPPTRVEVTIIMSPGQRLCPADRGKASRSCPAAGCHGREGGRTRIRRGCYPRSLITAVALGTAAHPARLQTTGWGD